MALFTQAELDRIKDLNSWSSTKPGGSSNVPAPPAPTSNSNQYSSNSGSSYGSSYSTPSYSSSNTPAPPAITQPARPQTNQSGQAQLPSWMGNHYSQVPGTNYYSTNPSNQNAAKYYADGSPVASVGFDYTQTGGGKFDGYASPDQWKQIMNINNSGTMNTQGGQQAMQNLLQGWQKEGSLVSNSSIYAPSGGYVSQPSSGGSMTSNSGTVYAPQSSMTNVPKLSGTQQSATDWINNSTSGQGGIASYINMQQGKYDAAVRSGDQNMINALNADMQRVGYSLNTSNSGQSQGQGQYNGNGNQNMGQNNGGAVQLPNGGWAPPGYGQMSQAQIQAEAAAKIAQQVSERTRIANQTKSGFNTSFDRLNKLTQDNRALENVSNQRNLNPFSGKSDYAQGMIAREREITDRQNQQDLQTRLGSVDSQLSEFLNQTPEMQQQLINDLTRQEREYGLQVGTLTGNLAGYGQTLASKNQEFNQGIAQQQLTLQQQEAKSNQERQAKVDNWNAYLQSVGLTGNLGTGAKADWSLLGGTNGEATFEAKSAFLQQEGQKINNEIAKLELANLPVEQKLRVQQLQKQIAEIGRAPYKSAIDAEYDKIKLDTAKEQLNQLRNPKTKTTDFKTSPEFASDVAHLKSNPAEASKLDSNPQPFIDAYGYDGYLALRKAAGIDD